MSQLAVFFQIIEWCLQIAISLITSPFVESILLPVHRAKCYICIFLLRPIIYEPPHLRWIFLLTTVSIFRVCAKLHQRTMNHLSIVSKLSNFAVWFLFLLSNRYCLACDLLPNLQILQNLELPFLLQNQYCSQFTRLKATLQCNTSPNFTDGQILSLALKISNFAFNWK